MAVIVLGIETSCDETSVAVVRQERLLANLVSSQVSVHQEYGGVVPELATREHLKNLAPLVRLGLQEAGVVPAEVDLVAATTGPGLPAALMVGNRLAQAFAFSLRKPFLGVHHHLAHLYSPWIMTGPAESRSCYEELVPNISLIVSGGHTMVVRVNGLLEYEVLGRTIDDAAGECFDKTAKLMGLGYPGGPEMDRLAAHGNPEAVPFPRPMLNDESFNFSFSGLKTAVRYFLRDNPALIQSQQGICDVAASVQRAIVEVLVRKTVRAAKRSHLRCITASGGVTCNRELRQTLAAACEKERLQLRMAEAAYCTDNAAMVAFLAEAQWKRNPIGTPFDAEVEPSKRL